PEVAVSSQLYTINLASGAASLVGTIGTGLQIRDIAVFLSCAITCPANVAVSNDPSQCGAVVSYPAPTTTGECGVVMCSPASGSFFPVGTTTVTCTTTGPSCSFTVTINDTQPPVITCPLNISVAAASSCPIATSSGPVNFTVTATDNCPGVTVICKNQNNVVVTSGSPFPVGTTTVTCTATDASGNTATCSFTVTAFSLCLQDETNPGNVVLFNTQTGQYVFCCNGAVVATGTGVLTIKGCIGTIDDLKGDRKVHIGFDTSARGNKGSGTAFLAIGGSSNPKCAITDKNMSNNTCACPAP
ncbi:MAG: HYR domain-containing protein, partial [Blastocatellia bacterium]